MSDALGPAVRLQKLRRKAIRFLRRLVPQKWHPSTPHPGMQAALGALATRTSDIRDHLGTIFHEAVATRPRLMVELGTRGGTSLRGLLAAAEVCDAHVLSVDIADCSRLDIAEHLRARWTFMCADDVAFAGEPFERFCAERGLVPQADVILIDTSHELEHTRAELTHWVPRLAPGGVLLFHDTHMSDGYLRRLDGKVEIGWNNARGVIQAVEEMLGRRYDETTFFADCVGGYAVRHVPWSSGFTVLRRLPD